MNKFIKEAMGKKTPWKATQARIDKGVQAVAWISLIIVLVGYANFINKNDFHTQTPVLVTVRKMFWTTPKTDRLTVVTVVKADGNVDPFTPDQRYACNKFGKDCAVAVAIMRAESHYRHDAININTNGTADLGCWQINTVHLKQIDTANINLLNCQDNTDVAYKIYKQEKGFGAWVTYTTGAYKAYLIN